MISQTRVGFIGLGNMGRPMAQRILEAGFPLTVNDVQNEPMETLVQQGAEPADSPALVAENSEVVFTCLPGPSEMLSVVFGRNGIVEGLKSGSIFVDHTTNSPTIAKQSYRKLASIGVSMLDAPVSGGVEGVKDKKLTVLVGGDELTLERCRSVLNATSSTIMHVGEIGTGSICKLMHNSASFSIALAMTECLTAGVKAGVSPGTLIKVFQQCALGRNFDLQVRLPNTLFKGDFSPRFSLKIARKDIGLGNEMARASGVQMPLANFCEHEMEEAMSRGWGDKDSSIFLTLQEERSGVKIRFVD